MDYSKIFTLIGMIIALTACAFGQDTQKRDNIYYETEEYLCRFTAPKDWRFNLDDARQDNYSAALLPDTSEYYSANIIIYIWIFGKKTYSFRQFVAADSLAYMKDNPEIRFKKTDSVLTESKQMVFYYETEDPGGRYKLTAVGYIPAGDEIIVYEMNISDRLFYSDAHFKFREALEGFSIEEKEE